MKFSCIVRWLSKYNILHRFVELIIPIYDYLQEKIKIIKRVIVMYI